MKVLVVTTWYPRRDAPGRAVFCRRHAEALALHHDVRVLSLDAPGSAMLTADQSPVPVELVELDRSRPASLPGALRAVRRRVREERPDVVVTMGFSALVVAPALRGTGVPWAHVEHWSGVAAPASVGAAWARIAPAALRLLALPDLVVTVSDYLGGVVHRYRRGPVAIVPNVVDAVAHLAPRPGALRLAAVGSLVPVKNPVLAVEALAVVRRSEPDATLRWAGDGPLRPQVEQRVAALGLTGAVELLGHVSGPDLEALYDWSSAVVMPSRIETFSVVAAEALGHGRPVVMGPEGGHRDFVTDELGACVDDLTPEGLAAAVLAEHERHRGVPAEHFRDALGDRFTAPRVADAFDAALARIAR